MIIKKKKKKSIDKRIARNDLAYAISEFKYSSYPILFKFFILPL